MSLEHSPASEVKNSNTGNIGRMLISDLEVAGILGCSRATVWRRVADGTLPKPIKIGHATRWLHSEIEAVIAAAVAKRDQEAPV